MGQAATTDENKPRINIAIVAGRRPDLLRKTLISFSSRALSSCTVGCVRANIDPIFGNANDELETVNCVRDFFPNAIINTPKKPGFAQAVRWLWSEMPDGPFFHLEDDWICLEDIPVKEILDHLNRETAMVTLTATNHRSPGKTRERTRQKKYRFLGIIYKRETVPLFGTSPCFASGEFARNVSSLLNTALDPEKQMRDDFNPALMSYLRNKRCLFHASQKGTPLIHDIGRDWREKRNISKTVRNGVSYWAKNG